MLAMRAESEAQAAQRRELLAPVARLCERAGVPVHLGHLERHRASPVVALLCTAADGSWDAAVTVVRAQPIAQQFQAYNGRWGRDPDTGYDLGSPGQLVFEIQIHEDDDGAGGHGPRPLVVFELVDDAVAASDSLVLWWRRPALFAATRPTPDRKAETRRRARQYAHREAAAADPEVRVVGVPPGMAVDPAALAWNFPRDHTGRYRRSAAVALAPLDGAGLHLRQSWLVARADGEALSVGTEDVIGANQEHRWNLTPWLWSGRHARTPSARRWQVDDAGSVRPILDLLDAGDLAGALTAAGVRTDDQIGKLLAGRPTRLYRAALTDTWVHNLYAGLATSAPWRFENAYREWDAERTGRHRPGVLFGLKGLNQQRKPKVALDVTAGGPMLRMVFTASNMVVPRALWTVPADLR